MLTPDVNSCIKVYLKKRYKIVDDDTAIRIFNCTYASVIRKCYLGAIDDFWNVYERFLKHYERGERFL
jgi:hypothetical protein